MNQQTITPGQNLPPEEILAQSRETVLWKDIPIALESTVLVRNRYHGRLQARCSFRSLTQREIKAVMVEITCSDIWGTPLGEPVIHQYLDLFINRDGSFGANLPKDIPNPDTRNISVRVTKVMLDDRIIDKVQGEGIVVPAPVPLTERLENQEQIEQFMRMTSPKAGFVPVLEENFWRCTCGCTNAPEAEQCRQCASARSAMSALEDPQALQAAADAYLQEKQEAEQRQRMEQEKMKAGKRKRRTIITVCSIAVALALIVTALFTYVIPYTQYNSAKKDMEAGNFDAAYQGFLDLVGFKDSDRMLLEVLYQKACATMEQGLYNSAIQEFEALAGYKDSPTMVKEAKYQMAKHYQEKKDYKRAYTVFAELKDYSDSKQCALAVLLLWEAEALASDTSTEAQELAKTVTLNESQREMFYTTVRLFLFGHEEADYWFDWGATAHVRNALTLLRMLPASYKDTQAFINLLSVMSNATNYKTIFRDHADLVWQCWPLPFVQNMACEDAAITYFLEGYWTDGSYYLEFYESSSGGTTSSHNLPAVEKPAGTKYFEIENMVYFWADANMNNLANVYRFEILDYDTIQVYCYKNGRTYTLYR